MRMFVFVSEEATTREDRKALAFFFSGCVRTLVDSLSGICDLLECEHLNTKVMILCCGIPKRSSMGIKRKGRGFQYDIPYSIAPNFFHTSF